ncbi:MAG: prenyltransferase, partial [Desulfonatronovibrio sp.]
MSVAAFISAVLCVLAGVLLTWLSSGWGPLALILSGMALLWAYSFGPFRLSYRGGGELLQMLGVGGVLPMVGYLAQHGSLAGISWPYMGLMLLLALSCAMSTSLPDEPSDRLCLKRSSSVILGSCLNQRVILALNALAFFLLVFFIIHGLSFTGMYIMALLCLALWLAGGWF